MEKDKALGMFMGLFIGDALGAPNEFIRPEKIEKRITQMVGGGVLDCDIGEWTDDGAMAMAIAEAYLIKGRFAPDEIADNFISWRKTGRFGTRDHVFDAGRTCTTSIARMTTSLPYAGSTDPSASGNGSIMRVAPIVLFNHHNRDAAVAQSVAVSLMTHGNADTVNYITAFVSELYAGEKLAVNDRLRGYNGRAYGSIMYAYATAWECVHNNTCFKHAVEDAINRGNDADTVGAVTGMLAGRVYGFKDIPKRWLRDLMMTETLQRTAEKLYSMGDLYAS